MCITHVESASFIAFERWLNDYFIRDIDGSYFEVTENICNLLPSDKLVQSVDSTKIEADANKYSFFI